MNVVALNERLRADFSPLLKMLPPPYTVSALSTIKAPLSSVHSPAPAASGDRYTQHCRFMLWRLNSYQYGSSSAFLMDLEQLERAAESPEIKQQVKSLLDRLAASEGEKQTQESEHKVSNSRGTTVALHSCCGVPGLQEVAPIGSEQEETENQTSWLCNVSLKDQIVTIGTFKTQKEALQGYEQQRTKMAENPAGLIKLKQLAAKMEQEQREEDRRVLREALAQCHPRLTTMKVSAVVPPAPAVNSAALALAARGVARSVAKTLAAASSPAASPAPSETGASPLRPSRSSKRQKVDSSSSAAAAKKQKVESANNSAASSSLAGNRSYLKLRRLIQKRLCRHLKGKEVCVVVDPEKLEEGRLRASGRLEAGKVFSFRRKKQMTFADYVRDELGRAESACPHMFLVRTRESIDDHLKVCDAFSDKEREVGPRNHAQSQQPKNKKASRRSR
ncbi:hypothetical protein PF005_g17306 [Phytophthora fragariae]|uniref:Uncharacterized protein n=1 Tax=Phytophthora fragariae TaxID=53985 RepID=A0A6A3XZR6_9STRA|nr:hypothetical protein PF003_g19347 [Phytophthora fragariae]KAE8931406.1 hypothetical protein PF009_g18532 [Phytophthora fragariae]KAE9095535.1 hypothetical protein PF007_g17347 [Phytophthora fragariae]KAE9128670.1 hypothetical protein PF006_g16222 [Phytophthora fragariae]KAE9195394.1 hypothetical protein PF005_g17306 [Phytophthora fragariae]